MKTTQEMQFNLLEFGDKVVGLRAEKDITQEQLAEHLHCSVRTVSDAERGKASPKFIFILSLAAYFDKDLNYFAPTKGEHSDNENR